MIPVGWPIAPLRDLAAQSWLAQLLAVAMLLAGYGLLLFLAWRLGRRNSADLKDANDDMKKHVKESDKRRQELRRQASGVSASIDKLVAQRPEERLAKANREREHGNEEIALKGYQDILSTFGPDLARCCEGLASATSGADAERFEKLRELLLAELETRR